MVRPYPIDIPYEELAEFCRANGMRNLSLFGSVVRDDFGPESDIDVLVEFEEGVRLGFRYFGIQDELAEMLGRKVDLLTPDGLSKYFKDAFRPRPKSSITQHDPTPPGRSVRGG